jgi:hypothetical protein
MKNVLTSIVFNFFKFSKAIGNSTDDLYDFKAIAIMTVFLAINVITAVAYLRRLTGWSSNFLLPVWQELLIIIVIGFNLHRVFVKNKSYERLFQEVEGNRRLNKAWLTIFYMLVSLALVFTLIWLPSP